MPEISQYKLTLADYDNIFEKELSDFPLFAKNHLKIKDEDGNIVPFLLNELQLYVWEGYIKPGLEQGIPIRLLVLKCRQTGISTMIEGVLYWISAKDAFQKMLILGHESKSSANLYDMFERFYKYSPEWMKHRIDTNQREKKIKYAETENEIDVQTAGANVDSQKAGTGRSSTYQFIHATECAFYPDYTTTFLGLLQASKKAKMIILETTANGFNDFKNDWDESKKGYGDYQTVFLAWNKFKSYSKNFESELERDRLAKDVGTNMRYNEYEQEETLLMSKHNCTLEQLNWRRWAIDNLCKAQVLLFHQEYPTTDTEAFISTGSAFFNKLIIEKNALDSVKPYKVGDLEYEYDNNKKPISVKFNEKANGYVKLHYKLAINPADKYRFVAGTDVSEGLEQGDRSIIKILDRKTMNVCITWSPHIDPDRLAIEQHKLYLFLGKDCWFNTERNNHGLTTISRAYHLGIPQYYEQDFEKGYEVDETTALGFRQTETSRRYVVDMLNKAIRDEEFFDSEEETWDEARTFVRNSKGKVQAQDKDKNPASKCFDDRIFALGLMWIIHLWLPSYVHKVVDVYAELKKELYEKSQAKKRADYSRLTIMSS